MIGQQHLVGPGGPLRALIEAGSLHSLLLWGPAGTGKTTIARLIARHTDAEFVTMSATSAGVKEVREIVEQSRRRLGTNGERTILFLDEIHRFSKAQQDALLPGAEEGLIILVGATTENPFFALTSPLLSRAQLFRLEALSADDLRAIAGHGLEVVGLPAAPAAVDHLIDHSSGDARAVLNSLETAAALARARQHDQVEVDDAAQALQFRRLPADRTGDAHYDQISAFIKSLRGSDPDAALYWMARMLERGEDPRYLARRMVILASEDIGLADPRALLVAVAAFHALEFVGLPEAGLNLAEAALYLARAPKSKASAQALWAAMADVSQLAPEPVPVHLRDSSYPGARRLGHGKGYVDPHDHPGHLVDQEYRPESARDHRYYEPSGMGEEER